MRQHSLTSVLLAPLRIACPLLIRSLLSDALLEFLIGAEAAHEKGPKPKTSMPIAAAHVKCSPN